jgi:arginyl-tRNA synthetase
MVERIRTSLAGYRVVFDNWFRERSLKEGDPSPIRQALESLPERATYRKDGALWLRTTELAGDNEDRVVIRQTGEPTYFAADIAYLRSKLMRGFDEFFIVLGSDHHGYVKRMKAAVAALGADPERLQIPLLQFVHIVERGERAAMSKRKGELVTLDELVREIGVDAARFFMLQRSHDSTVDIDLDLAREESSENPVYYVQYAHARIASILERIGAETVESALGEEPAGLDLHPSERELVRKLLAFPAEVAEAAARRAPHRIATYVLELGQAFAAFYRDCPVKDAEPEALKSFRIGLCVSTKRTLARALDLLGVSAPESM